MTYQLPIDKHGYQLASALTGKVLALALAYFVAARLGLSLPSIGSHITLIWLPAGIAIAALLRWGYGCWPGIFLGAFAAHFSIDINFGLSFSIALGSTLGSLLAVWLLRRLKFHRELDGANDILILAGAAAIGMLPTASIGIGSLWIFNLLPATGLVSAWLHWWMGGLLGVLLIAPVLLHISRAELSKLSVQGTEILA